MDISDSSSATICEYSHATFAYYYLHLHIILGRPSKKIRGLLKKPKRLKIHLLIRSQRICKAEEKSLASFSDHQEIKSGAKQHQSKSNRQVRSSSWVVRDFSPASSPISWRILPIVFFTLIALDFIYHLALLVSAFSRIPHHINRRSFL